MSSQFQAQAQKMSLDVEVTMHILLMRCSVKQSTGISFWHKNKLKKFFCSLSKDERFQLSISREVLAVQQLGNGIEMNGNAER